MGRIVVFLSFFLLLLSCSLLSQNLILNGGFEKHKSLDCLTCHTSENQFRHAMEDWDNLNSITFICDCQYSKSSSEKDYRYASICPDEINVTDNDCTIMQLRYLSNCVDDNHETMGCASYVGANTTQELTVGKKYSLSFSIYIPQPSANIGFAEHIGFMLYPDKIRRPARAMLQQETFYLPQIIYDSWYTVEWNFQPTCNLSYLVLGTFRGKKGPQVKTKFNEYNYFIDNVQLTEDKDENEEFIIFCKNSMAEKENVIPEIEGLTLYFESSSSNIQQSSFPALDSLAKRLKENPFTAFLISGHTDTNGNNHIQLSKNRIAVVLEYLENTHNIPAVRFIRLPEGDTKPIYEGAKNKQMKLNRRVEILQSDYEISDVIYRNFLQALFSEKSEKALKILNIWLYQCKLNDKMVMLHDPRLQNLKENNAWNNIVNRIKASYQKEYIKPNLAFTLDSLWAEDQKSRTLKYYVENLSVYLAEYDKDAASSEVVYSESEISDSDTGRINLLLEIIGNEGWVNMSEVGERAASTLFLILQHTSDLNLLNRYLPLLKEKCDIGEAKWIWYATMYDRIKVLQDLPQKYGTQYTIKDGKKSFFPMESKENVNSVREKIGLEKIKID